MKFDLKAGKRFGVKTSNDDYEVQYVHRGSLQAYLDDLFAKRPAVRAAIYESLYSTGSFDGWIEGIGVTYVIDAERYEAYCTEQGTKA